MCVQNAYQLLVLPARARDGAQSVCAGPQTADVFGEGKMILTCCCTIFGGWTKHDFENFEGDDCPVARSLIAGLNLCLR